MFKLDNHLQISEPRLQVVMITKSVCDSVCLMLMGKEEHLADMGLGQPLIPQNGMVQCEK